MTTQAYSNLSVEQKLALSQDEFTTSVKLEAIHRGIKIPMNLSEALKDQEFTGFQFPPDSVAVYQLCAPTSYFIKPTGICYKTEAEAKAALNNSLLVVEEGHGATARLAFGKEEPTIQLAYISSIKPKAFAIKLEMFDEPTDDFDKLCEELSTNLSELRQEKYNNEVRLLKKKNYIELAQGNEEIARAFWNKLETSTYPE